MKKFVITAAMLTAMLSSTSSVYAANKNCIFTNNFEQEVNSLRENILEEIKKGICIPDIEAFTQCITMPNFEFTTQAVTKPSPEMTTEATTQAITKPNTEFTTEATTQAVTKPNVEFTTEATTQAVTKPNTEFTTEATTQAVTKPSPEMTTEATTQAVTKPNVEFTTEATTQTVNNNSTYAQQVLNLVNEQRAANGLGALSLSTSLNNSAQKKAEDMRANNYFSHTSPNYGTPSNMLINDGISFRTMGENIAKGQKTPEAVVNAWMNSEGHRANILNSSYTQMGLGYSGGYWCQLFIG